MTIRKIIMLNVVCVVGAILILSVAFLLRHLLAEYLALPEQMLQQNVPDIILLTHKTSSFLMMVSVFPAVIGILNVILLIQLNRQKP